MRFGDRAFRFPLPAGASGRSMLAMLRSIPGVTDAIVTEEMGCVVFDRAEDAEAIEEALRAATRAFGPSTTSGSGSSPDAGAGAGASPGSGSGPEEATIVRVIYDGEDLDAVAASIGMTREETIALHTAPTYEVAMLGFMPGFAYLRGLPEALRLARRAPRPRVPANSVAIAAEYTGIYPFESPGGWHLLGRAIDFIGFDAAGAKLQTGDRVRFEAVPTTTTSTATSLAHPSPIASKKIPSLRITRASGYGVIVDHGRAGHRHEGVPPSGPLVRSAHARANAMVKNAPATAALEVTGTFEVTACDGDVTIATDTSDAPRELRDGESFVITTANQGARVRYLAVAGGFDGPIVLGSRSPLLAMNVGRPVRRADRLAVRSDFETETETRAPSDRDHESRAIEIEVELIDPSAAALLSDPLRISPACDRTGTRLDPTHASRESGAGPNERALDLRSASTPMVVGAIELTPSGLIVIGPDGPTTGGYPVVAVVSDRSLDRLFSRPIGAAIRFVAT